MKRENRKPGEMLDKIASEIRDQPIDAARLEQAARRVRESLAQEGASTASGADILRDCNDFHNAVERGRQIVAKRCAELEQEKTEEANHKSA